MSGFGIGGGVELLAPAKDAACGRAALLCGADAVYIGGPRFGARGRAGNAIEDIAGLARFAHVYRAKVYLAINTLLTDAELPEAVGLAWRAHEAGIDGLILQDMGLLECDLPPLPLIASTQTHNADPEKVLFLERAGFRRAILARELTIAEIREIRARTAVELECFIHGALCVCYSGQCYLSYAIGGRSGNRGECAQPCRRQYALEDADGRVLVRDRHLLSLKDLNLTPDIGALLDAGVTAFKIEGRLKDEGYVKNVVSHYRRVLDAELKARGLRRASLGESDIEFDPDPAKSFNRGFTEYFLHGRRKGIGSFETPKSLGAQIGSVSAAGARGFTIPGGGGLRPGDGIAFLDADGQLRGTAVRKVEGDRVEVSDAAGLRPRVAIHRNLDREFENRLARGRVARRLAVDVALRGDGAGFTLEARDPEGVAAAVRIPAGQVSGAKDPEGASRVWREQMGKLGGTEFRAGSVEVACDPAPFAPVGKIAQWRRELVENLRAAREAGHAREAAEAPRPTTHPFPQGEMGFEGNVLNAKARAFYERHGVRVTDPAAETGTVDLRGRRVMTTKHCIRFELGLCPREEPRTGSPEPLWLVDDRGRRFRIEFDCGACRMEVWMGTAEGKEPLASD